MISPAQRPDLGTWTPNTSSPQMSGLISWYPLQEFRGGSFEDVITSRMLKFSGTAGLGWTVPLVNSTIGQMLNFDGTNSQADVAGSTSGTDAFYSLAGSFSLSAWIIPNISADGYIFSHRSTAGGEAGDYHMGVTTAGKFFGGFFSGAFRGVTGTQTLVNGTLYHVIVSFDDPGNTMNLYVNGVLDATGAITQALAAGTVPTHIGYSHIAAVPQNRWNGGMADLRLYNKALTAQEAWGLFDPNTRWDLYGQGDVYAYEVLFNSAIPTFNAVWAQGSNAIYQPGIQ